MEVEVCDVVVVAFGVASERGAWGGAGVPVIYIYICMNQFLNKYFGLNGDELESGSGSELKF